MTPSLTLLEKTDQLFHNARVSTLEAAAALYEVKETEAWKERANSWSEYLHTLGLSQGQASKYLIVIEHYQGFSQRKLAEATDLERLYLATTLEGTPEEQFEKALVLSRSELRSQHSFEENGVEHTHECLTCHTKWS